jgi:replicative DNA helicase
MNRIVRQHYPAAKLPDDLRGAFDQDDQVTVTVEQEAASVPEMSLEEILAIADRSQLSKAEIDEHLTRLRDEWKR